MAKERARITIGTTLLFVALAGAPALAQTTPTYVGGNPPGGESGTNQESPTTVTSPTTTTVGPSPSTTITGETGGIGEETSTTLGEEFPAGEEDRGGPAETEDSSSGPLGELPFTGGDVAGLVVIGAAAVGAGFVLVRRSKTARA